MIVCYIFIKLDNTTEEAAESEKEVKLTTGYFLNFIDFISELEKENGKKISTKNIIPSILANSI